MLRRDTWDSLRDNWSKNPSLPSPAPWPFLPPTRVTARMPECATVSIRSKHNALPPGRVVLGEGVFERRSYRYDLLATIS